MRQLVAEDGHRGGESAGQAGRERGADGHAVGEVVQAVADNHHPGHGAGRAARLVDVAVRVRVTVMAVLVLVDDDREVAAVRHALLGLEAFTGGLGARGPTGGGQQTVRGRRFALRRLRVQDMG